MTDAPIAFTGVTGALGKLVIPLLDESVSLRFLARDPSRCPTDRPNSQAVQAFYKNDQQTVEALRGCHLLFMVSAAEDESRLEAHFALIDAACRAGVRQIVYTSFFGAAADAEFRLARDHFHTERHIRESGVGYTFLRNNLYADILPTFGPAIKGPAGAGRLCPVSRLDVARSIAAVLRSPELHENQTYSLTGSQSLTLDQVVQALNENSNGADPRFTFENESMEQARASRSTADPPPPAWMVEAWISTYTAIAKGELDGMTDDVQRLTDRPAESFDDFARRWASEVRR